PLYSVPATTRSKHPKMRSTCSGAMPRPWSATARRARVASALTQMVTSVPAPYLSAFVRRFVTTCSSRERSHTPTTWSWARMASHRQEIVADAYRTLQLDGARCDPRLQVLVEAGELGRLLPDLRRLSEQFDKHRHLGPQDVGVNGLDDVVHGPQGVAPRHQVVVTTRGRGGEKDNGGIPRPLALAEQPCCL